MVTLRRLEDSSSSRYRRKRERDPQPQHRDIGTMTTMAPIARDRYNSDHEAWRRFNCRGGNLFPTNS
ncbi:hypothetical protein TIFTF001_016414 [Ficus carica]|uniref:Uncharacterized protein n=1 Tax=Ficus carica TaxID=3494 RepID=A0AA88AAI0_FICCA|nr:hypothetical protein TIFTF001_016414 [Ficus carica]